MALLPIVGWVRRRSYIKLVWDPLRLCFYAPGPNSNFLFSEPVIPGLFPDFPRALGDRGCVWGKSCIKPKHPILRSPTTLLLCIKAEFLLFI